MRWTLVWVLLVGGGAAWGQTPPATLDARAVADAPPPERSDGVASEDESLARDLLWVPRLALYVPRRAIELVFEPLRAASFVWDRFRIPERFKEAFFNESGTFGIFPVAFVDTGFGLNAGLRLMHSDMFGAGESLLLRASFGGRYQQFYSASIDSGRRLGNRFKLKLRGGYEVGPQDAFYGIGNGDQVSRDQVTQRVDPLVDDTAISTQYRKDLAYAKLSLEAKLIRHTKATVSVEGRYQDFSRPADEADFNNYYLVNRLAGIEQGTYDVYPQLRLTFDNRQTGHAYMSEAMSARGFYLNGWLGYAKGFRTDPSNHLRYAADLQWFIDVLRGDRVLILRLLLDGVTADLDKIPFVDLPDLGGPLLLRGYPIDRFRDRVATLGSVEYQYNLTFQTTAYVFIDTGRVWRSLEDFAFERFRMGFGGGIMAHSRTSFLARVQLASSIDGGLFVSFSLDPVYDTRTREEAK